MLLNRLRIGNSYDIHQLVVNRPLILGGVLIPFDKGLLGHSDGDALIHTVMDSLLSAAGLADIGLLFPPSDSQWKNANSMDLLGIVNELLIGRNATIINIDSTIIAEQPKLSPYYQQMKESIAKGLNLDIAQVGIKSRTNEKLDAVGEGKAIAVYSTVLIYL